MDKSLKLTIFALGFTTTITQLVIIREFYNFFGGNELIVGIIFANWMLILGMGALVGKYLNRYLSKSYLLLTNQLLFAILPIISILILRYIRVVIFGQGVSVNMNNIFIISFVVLLFFCFLSGLLFTQLSKAYSDYKNRKSVVSVYFIETLGSIIGGLLFSFILVFYLKTFEILRVLLIINLIFLILLSNLSGKKIFSISVLTLLIFVVFTFNFDLDIRSKRDFFSGQEIVYDEETPYGNITVTKMAEQYNFFENGLLLHSTGDYSGAEEKVHFAMSLHPYPQNVLLISGAISGTVMEIQKYGNVSIDYIDINPFAIKVAKKFKLLPEKGISIITQDPIIYLKNNSQKRYDIVIIDLPEPVNAQINNYYTESFFQLLASKINNHGIISTSLNGTANYLNDKAAELHSILYNTISTVFNHVIIVPGSKNFFIFSQDTLEYNFTKNISDKGIENLYVNKYYIDDRALQRESDIIYANIDKNAQVNTNLRPVAYFSQINYRLNQSGINLNVAVWITVILLIIMALRFNPVNFCLFSGGFAGTSLEIIIIMGFQFIYGYLYGAIGVIISMMMIGMAAGAFLVKKKILKPITKTLVFLQILLSVFSLILPLTFIILLDMQTNFWWTHIFFIILTLLLGLLIGAEFSVSAGLLKKNASATASELYSADLMGAALGAILASAFLVPLIGILYVCYLVAIINALSALYLYIKRENYKRD
ncbi:MAG: hypothetical protein PHT69_14045 [Bacteroidales bacterium]|nr:hypothetical protein [Bacteroidales bacterium]